MQGRISAGMCVHSCLLARVESQHQCGRKFGRRECSTCTLAKVLCTFTILKKHKFPDLHQEDCQPSHKLFDCNSQQDEETSRKENKDRSGSNQQEVLESHTSAPTADLDLHGYDGDKEDQATEDGYPLQIDTLGVPLLISRETTASPDFSKLEIKSMASSVPPFSEGQATQGQATPADIEARTLHQLQCYLRLQKQRLSPTFLPSQLDGTHVQQCLASC
ncbi:hypothetical protein NMY22_g14241 [Coprinellus aureogranulatus]|nr:hypothetical protein NMY22_g14241 [Coprinellus aureogranulatus]